MSRWEIAKEFLVFFRERRNYVLAPLIVLLLLMAAFILLAEVPVLTPFIYALF